MGNFIVALIIFGFFSLLIIGTRANHKENKATAIMTDSGHYLVQYLGGSPHIDAISNGYIKPREEALVYLPQNSSTILTQWNNVKSLEVKTHEQITNDITLGRVLTLGVFALAAKKQNVHTKQYLVIHCEEEGVIYDMIFTGEGIGALASRINKALINYRKTSTPITQVAIN